MTLSSKLQNVEKVKNCRMRLSCNLQLLGAVPILITHLRDKPSNRTLKPTCESISKAGFYIQIFMFYFFFPNEGGEGIANLPCV